MWNEIWKQEVKQAPFFFSTTPFGENVTIVQVLE